MKDEKRYDLEPIAWDGDRLMFSMPSDNLAELLGGLEEVSGNLPQEPR